VFILSSVILSDLFAEHPRLSFNQAVDIVAATVNFSSNTLKDFASSYCILWYTTWICEATELHMSLRNFTVPVNTIMKPSPIVSVQLCRRRPRDAGWHTCRRSGCWWPGSLVIWRRPPRRHRSGCCARCASWPNTAAHMAQYHDRWVPVPARWHKPGNLRSWTMLLCKYSPCDMWDQ